MNNKLWIIHSCIFGVPLMLPVRKDLAFQRFEGDRKPFSFSFLSTLLNNLASWKATGPFVEGKYHRNVFKKWVIGLEQSRVGRISQEEVMEGLDRFCIPRRNGNIKVLCKWTKEMGQGRNSTTTHRRGWASTKDVHVPLGKRFLRRRGRST